jgi:hypothetical protein
MAASIDALLAVLMTFMLFLAESISEAGYKQPDFGGEPYTNNAEVPSGFLKSTAKLDQPLALKKARTVHGGGLHANAHEQLCSGKNATAHASI